MAYKTGNPALNKDTFNKVASVDVSRAMTLTGTAYKSLALLILAFASGAYGWYLLASGKGDMAAPLIIGSLFIGFIMALVTIFKPKVSPFTTPVYAVLEGFMLGAISQAFDAEYPGIAIQAVLLTGGIFLCMLIAYITRAIRATENFKLAVVSATGGIALYYLADLLFSAFHHPLPLVNSNSTAGIIFSIVVVVIAAANLVLDFDFIEQGVEKRAPKYMEWYASFGLFVTIVWLYLEILRLLAKSRSR